MTSVVVIRSRRWVITKNVQGNLFADGLDGDEGGRSRPDAVHDRGRGRRRYGRLPWQRRRRRDVEVKVLIDCTADETERVRRLLDDVLGIGGLFVRRCVETATA